MGSAHAGCFPRALSPSGGNATQVKSCNAQLARRLCALDGRSLPPQGVKGKSGASSRQEASQKASS